MRLQINAHGLRGPDRPYEKPPGVRRVLLLGDSITEGYSVEEPYTLRSVLEALLNSRGEGRFEVINGGTAGYSTDQEYLFYVAEGVRYEPDVVVLLFCYNDLYPSLGGEGGNRTSTSSTDGWLSATSPSRRSRWRAANGADT